MSIKLTFLGTGSAFAKRNYQTNLLIENGIESILIDCGNTALRSLVEMKKDPADIRNIFITHLHADHCGGLEEVAFMHYFVFRPQARKRFTELHKKYSQEIKLFPTEDIEKKEYGKLLYYYDNDFKPVIISTAHILRTLWDDTLKGGLNSIQGHHMILDDYFKLENVCDGWPYNSFNRCGLQFELIRTDHLYVERKFEIPSYGFVIKNPETGTKVFYTGDTKFDCGTFEKVFKDCNSIFHDCQLFDQSDSIHATYNELKGLPSEIRSKMWLMHYGDTFDQFDPVKDGFKGFVEQHKEYDFEEI